MVRLEELKKGTRVKGLLSNDTVTIVDIQWRGSSAVELTFKDSSGKPDSELVYRDREPDLEIEQPGSQWGFDGDGHLLRLVSEAYRIRLAHLFDPLLAVHTSIVEPLPHQITAVYEEMLPRQPLRFLLADDPGAGKTIMTGLFIKELIARGDLVRCLICCPGSLTVQWQEELWNRFQLDFKIISNQTIEDSKSGNPYNELDLIISRLDHMSRNESIREKLKQTEWDLVVVDEAHKMSAHFYGNEVKETQRYKLGRLLGAPKRTRHFLLLTATPHSGKEEDFQLFLSLLDSDRFEGRFRDGTHGHDTSDLMRRLVKEQLVRFDNTPLFPERIAKTLSCSLSEQEKELYDRVTEYVRQEMNRADRLIQEGEGIRGNRVGFALTILQRRLASSPEAIYQSLRRRRERLEKRINQELQAIYNNNLQQPLIQEAPGLPEVNRENLEDWEEAPDDEQEIIETILVEQASAARTIPELKAEVQILKNLEEIANKVRLSGADRKWEELSELLQKNNEMFDQQGQRRKLIIFSEHKDTINYLIGKIGALIGRPEAIVTIHGGVGRDERLKVQEAFNFRKDVIILVASDAAGEGINLQRAHLMVNYDLPWNPNRLEQRFGRIHRIGQTEVCHMWSIVAMDTREGEVFQRLLHKLEVEREALGSGVFDVLGTVCEGIELRKLLIQAIRYGDQPEVKEKLKKQVDRVLDHQHLQNLLEERALAADAMDTSKVKKIREDMDRAEARRLQPHFIRSFFLEAFKLMGGTSREREPKRYEITHVPAVIKNAYKQMDRREPLLSRYERICFEKEHIRLEDKPHTPPAAFICPGHPLLDATIRLILLQNKQILKKGAVLVDTNDESNQPRVLVYLENNLLDGRIDRHGNRRIISQRMQFLEINEQGKVWNAGYAPYLDYEPINEKDRALIQPLLNAQWLKESLEKKVMDYAVEHIVPEHIDEVRKQKEIMVSRTIAAVKDRLTREINYWDRRANELKEQELAGKPNAKINSGKARQRADQLYVRMQERIKELEEERQIAPSPPVIIGAVLVIPGGLIKQLSGLEKPGTTADAEERERIRQLALQTVMDMERKQNRVPRDVEAEKKGYDIESAVPGEGKLLFIEVKGRRKDAETVTITKNEILTCLNKPEQFILAVVLVENGVAEAPIYIKKPFGKEPDFAVTSVNYNLKELTARGEVMS
jgi:SNF2 family DNA or RNA helicase